MILLFNFLEADYRQSTVFQLHIELPYSFRVFQILVLSQRSLIHTAEYVWEILHFYSFFIHYHFCLVLTAYSLLAYLHS